MSGASRLPVLAEGEVTEQAIRAVDWEMEESDTEPSEHHVAGGYMDISVGSLLDNGRYRILQKAGFSDAATLWFAVDERATDGPRLVAIKAAMSIKEGKANREATFLKVTNTKADREWVLSFDKLQRELPDLPLPSVRPHRPRPTSIVLLDRHFTNPNGREEARGVLWHMCLVLEPLGHDLRQLVKQHPHGVPLPIVRKVATHVLLGLDYLHRHCGVFRGNLKPAKVAATIPSPSGPHPCTPSPAHPSHTSPSLPAGELYPSHSDPSLLSSHKQTDEAISTEKTALYRTKRDGATDEERVKMDVEARQREREKRVRHWVADHRQERGDETGGGTSVRLPPSVLPLGDTIDADNEGVDFKIVDLSTALWEHNSGIERDPTTRQYHAPEMVLGHHCTSAVDIFAAGCLLYRLAAGTHLIDVAKCSTPEICPRRTDPSSLAFCWGCDAEQLVQVDEVVCPRDSVSAASRYSRDLVKEPFLKQAEVDNEGGCDVLAGHIYHLCAKKGRVPSMCRSVRGELQRERGMDEESADAFAAFLLPLLRLDPAQRCTARRALGHPWLRGAGGVSPPLSQHPEPPAELRGQDTIMAVPKAPSHQSSSAREMVPPRQQTAPEMLDEGGDGREAEAVGRAGVGAQPPQVPPTTQAPGRSQMVMFQRHQQATPLRVAQPYGQPSSIIGLSVPSPPSYRVAVQPTHAPFFHIMPVPAAPISLPVSYSYPFPYVSPTPPTHTPTPPAGQQQQQQHHWQPGSFLPVSQQPAPRLHYPHTGPHPVCRSLP
ncbi:unnamed protein product [Vitrella brassicaformis CCMP3155]|uniref:non-specific serine/threonine protein kinase n=2 Tax=Vitrella brassicaformis TaxID=1169539 RepID=A0A0G4FF31_VITBC|nr:unnamed protein product [Vitrella brassicaformis CCMP3155]|eukprot:CEM11445.1 unnamed protein product [Vitrella brassicaformis CCMP3155]